LTFAAALFAYLVGVRDGIPLFGYALIAFVVATTTGDIYWATRARQKNTQENFAVAFMHLLGRNRRRYGGYLIHLAVMVLAIGVIGSRAYATDETRALTRGESFTAQGYTLTFEGIQSGIPDGEGILTRATVGVYRNGQRLATLHPANVYYPRQQQPETEPAIYDDAPFFRNDLYIIINNWTGNLATVSFRAYVNPMVSWVWFGGLLFLISTVVTLMPDTKESTAGVREFAPGPSPLSYSQPSE
jgi:cytochrome c-type biogenesis protein CcmF